MDGDLLLCLAFATLITILGFFVCVETHEQTHIAFNTMYGCNSSGPHFDSGEYFAYVTRDCPNNMPDSKATELKNAHNATEAFGYQFMYPYMILLWFGAYLFARSVIYD